MDPNAGHARQETGFKVTKRLYSASGKCGTET